MPTPLYSKKFKKNYKKLKRSGRYNTNKLRKIMNKLGEGEVLEEKFGDHSLLGDWYGCRDCHVEGDWVLIYELGVSEDGNETITFHATGNHSNLFQ